MVDRLIQATRLQYQASHLHTQITRTRMAIKDSLIQEPEILILLGLIDQIEDKAQALKEIAFLEHENALKEFEHKKQTQQPTQNGDEENGIEASAEIEEAAEDIDGRAERQWENLFESIARAPTNPKLGHGGGARYRKR